jgi:hypothetical protein
MSKKGSGSRKAKVRMPPAPAAVEDRVFHADWLELRALLAADGNSSIEDLVREFRRGQTTESNDKGSQASQNAAEAAFAELIDRSNHCGGAYPFDLGRGFIQYAPNDHSGAIYIFLLLLHQFGKDAGPSGAHGERLFEEVCCRAAELYFGGPGQGGRAAVFGFPRRILPKSFCAALSALCFQMGEGVGSNMNAPLVNDQKDATLDIVAWRNFADGRAGKIIGFGQCATGFSDWRQKATEMRPDAFSKIWMQKTIAVDPLRMFFVPWRVPEDDWHLVCVLGGVLFERCRVAQFARDLVPFSDDGVETRERIAACLRAILDWNASVVDRLRSVQRVANRAA